MKLTIKTATRMGVILVLSSCVFPAIALPKPARAKALIPKSFRVPETINVATDSVYTNKPLAGLRGVWVCVEPVDPDAQKDGLDPVQVKVSVELELRKAGITVYDKINTKGNDSMATVDVNIKTSKDETGLYRYALLLEFSETVSLMRPTNYLTGAATWSTIDYGTVGSTKMAPSLRQSVDDQVDKFANDYLAQNPK